MVDIYSDGPFPTVIEFEQNEPEGFGGPRNVRINGQRVTVQEMTVKWADKEWSEVTLVLRGCRVVKEEPDKVSKTGTLSADMVTKGRIQGGN